MVNIVKDEDMKDIKRERIQNWNNDRKNCHENTDKLRPIAENSAFMFHKDFYPKPRITLLYAELSPKIQQQLDTLLQELSDIMSKSSSNIGLTHLEEMVLHTEPGSIPIVHKPYSLPLKHYKFIKEELTNLLEAGLIEQSLGPYAAPIMVVPQKAPAGSSLTEMKRLVIDNGEQNKQLPKVQMVQAKAKGTIALIETVKIDHIWAKLKGARYFSSLDIRAGYHHISIHPDSRPKTAFICPYGKFPSKCVSYSVAHALSIFLNATFKLFFEYLDDFLIFYVDDIIVYSKMESEHLVHLRKVFEKFRYAGMKLKPPKCDFFTLHIEYSASLNFWHRDIPP